jgi:hypothetical protein
LAFFSFANRPVGRSYCSFSNVVGDATPIFFNTIICNETIIYCA